MSNLRSQTLAGDALMLGRAKAVGHAGEVVADDAVGALVGDADSEAIGKEARIVEVRVEERADRSLRVGIGAGDIGMVIDSLKKELFEFDELNVARRGKKNQRLRCRTGGGG